MNMDTIKEIDVKSVMTKSSLPVGGYSVNPYVGCPHACRYCYASFMKRFTGHTEPWGTFLDVKNWKPITNPHKYDGERVVIGSVTDGYNPYEEEFHRTRRLLEELRGSDAEIMICTKSDLVLRDLDLLKSFPKVTVSWSVNTLDEQFCVPFRLPIGEIAHSCHEPHMRTGRIDDAQFSFHVFRHGKVVGNVETAAVVTGIAVRASYSAPYHYVHVFYQGFNADTHNTTVSPSSGIISRLMSAS